MVNSRYARLSPVTSFMLLGPPASATGYLGLYRGATVPYRDRAGNADTWMKLAVLARGAVSPAAGASNSDRYDRLRSQPS